MPMFRSYHDLLFIKRYQRNMELRNLNNYDEQLVFHMFHSI